MKMLCIVRPNQTPSAHCNVLRPIVIHHLLLLPSMNTKTENIQLHLFGEPQNKITTQPAEIKRANQIVLLIKHIYYIFWLIAWQKFCYKLSRKIHFDYVSEVLWK